MEDQSLHGNLIQCRDCVKFDSSKGICKVFTEPYPLWGKGTCWAREYDRAKWLKVLKQIIEYDQSRGRASRQVIAQIRYHKKILGKEIRQCFWEDSHRPLHKPPKASDSQDRTHKLFTKERMKDNRYIEPWSGFDIFPNSDEKSKK